jgi:hypothetical protein
MLMNLRGAEWLELTWPPGPTWTRILAAWAERAGARSAVARDRCVKTNMIDKTQDGNEMEKKESLEEVSIAEK